MIDADLRSAPATAWSGAANFTCAGTARAGTGRLSRRKAGLSGPRGCWRSRRKLTNFPARPDSHWRAPAAGTLPLIADRMELSRGVLPGGASARPGHPSAATSARPYRSLCASQGAGDCGLKEPGQRSRRTALPARIPRSRRCGFISPVSTGDPAPRLATAITRCQMAFRYKL